MIVGKIKSRGNGQQLGNYLVNDPKNAEAEVMEVRGFENGADLAEAFDLAEIMATEATRGDKVFAFAAIVPEDGERLTREQVLAAVENAERHLGFQGLDRVIVRHLKNDRRPDEGDHYHVVWNRHDKETGKLRSDSHSGRNFRVALDEIEERFGLRQRDRSPEAEEARTKASDAEARQDERSTKGKRERVEEITGLWNRTDSGKAFRAALEDAGYTLAHGKSRAYCVVDQAGEVHSLAKQIRGAKTADVRARLADLDPASIPEAEAIRASIKQARDERAAEISRAPQPSRAERRAQQARDADAIRAVDAEPSEQSGAVHVPTPSERTDAERAASAGMAAAILDRLTAHRSTFTRTDLEREAAKMTGHQVRDVWMTQTGGLDGLDERHRASAERSYERWAEEKPQLAERYGLADYVSYAQAREQERQATQDPDTLRHRQDRAEAFKHTMVAIDASGDVVNVGPDPRNPSRDRFTSKSMLTAELEMEAAAATLAARGEHTVTGKNRDTTRRQTEKAQGFDLSMEQRAAVRHVTGADDLSLVVGYAGAGKSTMLAAARSAWEAQGFRVRGAALSGIAARGLEDSAGIKSTTLDALLHRLDGRQEREAKIEAEATALREKMGKIRGTSEKARNYRGDLARKIGQLGEELEKSRLTERDVIVVDEAAMIGSRKMGRLLAHAVEGRAKVVLVGDHEQVQAIEAGAAFRALMERHGAAVMKDVRRQGKEWQRAATKDFAEGRAREALDSYRDKGMVHETVSRDDAKSDLIGAWSRARAARPDDSSIILTHLNADVHDLNRQARAAYKAEGRLGEDHELALKDGKLTLADGDRVLFRKNDSHLDVKNGSLGTVRKIEGDEITVALDTSKGKAGHGREVKFSLSEYEEISHGYAATVHKSQGSTVDRAFVLATPGMDRHTSYVAMSRHRDRADLFHAREDFRGHEAMTRRLSRSGAKDSVLDYMRRAETGGGFARTLRTAVAAVWETISSVFKRGDIHPAEAAQQAREQAERAARRPSERAADAIRAKEERVAPPKVDPAHAKERVRPASEPRQPEAKKPEPTAEELRAAARAAELAERQRQIDKLREDERKRQQGHGWQPGGGRGG
jgi:ATP-dependent exoDNAse (exonuclease V) alpha subunit